MAHREDYEYEAKQALKTLKRAVTEGFGGKCDKYTPGCRLCDVWHHYEFLEAIWDWE